LHMLQNISYFATAFRAIAGRM